MLESSLGPVYTLKLLFSSVSVIVSFIPWKSQRKTTLQACMEPVGEGQP